jgi:hypothetical protein
MSKLRGLQRHQAELLAQRAVRYEAIRELKQANPEMTSRAISEVLKIPAGTVQADLVALGFRSRLTPEQRCERDERIRAHRAEHPAFSLGKVAEALGLTTKIVGMACPAPERRKKLGYADSRLEAAYEKLQRDYVATASLLCREAGTCYVTAQRYLRRFHPECLVNFRGVRASVKEYTRTNGRTVKASRRRFPKLCPFKSKPRLTPEQRAERRAKARELAASGLNKSEIAVQLGCCAATIVADLRDE